MSQQSKLASWQQLKAQASQPTKVEEPTKLEIILTPSIVEQEILVDLTNLEENTTQVQTIESISEPLEIETVKKSNKKGTVNV